MSIQVLSAEKFRQQLAGHIDPLKKLDDVEQSALKDETVRFCSILPELFGDDLDRKTLWERIGNGLKVALAKSGGDFEAFVNHTLEYIKSEPGKVAANENLEMFISTALTRPKEWRNQFMRVIEMKHFLVLVKARALWNERKGGAK
jgi:hypothetical protein